MRFYFPDSNDQIDPNFDWDREEHPDHHVRQRDDVYAHEALSKPGFQGILVSKPIVDGMSGKGTRYTTAQRHRLYRNGVHRFFRLPQQMRTLGDCGAFTYVDEEEPPITPIDALEFYEGCRFDEGISVDHVILGYIDEDPDRPQLDVGPGTSSEQEPKLEEFARRQTISLDYADEFIGLVRSQGLRVTPVGAAQGWSPSSYAESVRQLQKMGYTRIALGGLVAQKTHQILRVLQAVDDVRDSETQLHLLGVTRLDHIHEFARFGVTSFDSTAPFRQAFMDDRNNYHWPDRKAYTTLRVPPVGGNAAVKRMIKSGQLDQQQALEHERRCLELLTADTIDVDETVAALDAYLDLLQLQGTKTKVRTDEHRRLLEDAPWTECKCGVCEQDGVHVAIFRGTERNKRRGFHNISVFGQQLADTVAEHGLSDPLGKVEASDTTPSGSQE